MAVLGLISMPSRISLGNQKRIIRLYLEGHPQSEIADRVGFTQPTVSNEVNKFMGVARSSSLKEASTMYDVTELVDELRALSVDLRRLRKSPRECLEAAKSMRSILEAGLDTTDASDFLRLCKKLQGESSLPEDYLQSAVRLSRLEEETGKGYPQILEDFQDMAKRLKGLEGQIGILHSENRGLEESRSSLQKDLEDLEEGVKKRMNETALTNDKIGRALGIEALMKRAGVSDEGLEGFLGEMKALNWDLETVTRMMKELRGAGSTKEPGA